MAARRKGRSNRGSGGAARRQGSGGGGGGGRLRSLIGRTAEVFDVARDEAEEILRTPRRQSIRVNPLVGRSDDEIAAYLDPVRSGLVDVAWCDDAFHLDLQPGEAIASEAIDNGSIFIQNAASFIPVLALDPQPGERILDLCAAPGGKSSHIAAITGNQAELWLNDGIETRTEKMRGVLDLLGVEAASITSHPGQHIDRHLEGPFDRILIDAQCTGEGMIDLGRPNSARYWSYQRVQKYSFLQRKMLMRAANLLRPGGVLVYSTCTFAPEENEIPIDHVLKHRPELRLESVEVDAPGMIPARTSWKGESLDDRLHLARRVRPSTWLEGFFVARLRRDD